MATRAAAGVPQQNRGGAVAGKKGVPTDGNNRRALGDVSNLLNTRVVEGKPLPNRPVTRSFVAQLLGNAQAQAAATKKPVTLVADGVVAGKAKAAKQRAPAAPKPKPEVIEISPDTEEAKPKPKPEVVVAEIISKKSVKELKKSGKKVHTFTSVLTARSKVACGLSERPEEKIEDIDAGDSMDQLAVVEYVEDIYTYYKLAETSCKVHDYMGSQTEINEKMRAILADWLIEVHSKFELMPETLYLTQHIIDHYLSMQMVPRRELQLVGLSAMLIACKYEEIWAPEINDFICISDKAYSREQILGMETAMLNKLEWSLTVPTPYMFLVRFLKAALADKEMEDMVFFYAELGLMQYGMISYCPSMIAASAVYAARCTLNKCPCWNATLKRHTGFSEEQLMDCAKLLALSHSMVEGSKLKVVYRKYSGSQHGEVALHPPAKKLIGEEPKPASA
ncbi:hypothetical protein QJS10_CPB04g00466 [Acorus calamus]|uniref:Cyclin N-terminal domain-containing protein n=1 Tax=Acorus calamus TaxID=4465 RepID=A0AAV9F3B8_ACOCL|nr:hypothetical protein QJS10_CPB04g00466 [Acorus calamus]